MHSIITGTTIQETFGFTLPGLGSDKSVVTKFEGKSPDPSYVSPFHQLASLWETTGKRYLKKENEWMKDKWITDVIGTSMS